MAMHRAQYWADVEALATEACPPLELFEHGRDWLHVGKELRQTYSRTIRQAINVNEGDDTVFDAARAASEAFLNQWPAGKRGNVLIGASPTCTRRGRKLVLSKVEGMASRCGMRLSGS